MTCINRHYDERKARRELLVKTAWDYFSSKFEIAKLTGGALAPFEVFVFYTVKVVELAVRKNLSDEKTLDEMRKIHHFEKALMKVIKEV